MTEDIFGLLVHIIFRVQINWKPGFIAPEKIPNSHLDSITGRFLIAPLIDPELLLLKCFQQIDGHFLIRSMSDSFRSGFFSRSLRILHQVLHGPPGFLHH